METAPQLSEDLGHMGGCEKLDHILSHLPFGLDLVGTIQLGG